mgnify:FL=1
MLQSRGNSSGPEPLPLERLPLAAPELLPPLVELLPLAAMMMYVVLFKLIKSSPSPR